MPSGRGLAVERRDRAGLPALAPEAEVVVYRVAQEALTNGCATRTRVGGLALGVRDGGASCVVGDDGSGTRPRSAQGARHAGMRERAVLVGATSR